MVSRLRRRAGKGTVGCLFSIFLLVAAGYFALNTGRPYWLNYQYQDRMTQEARFASQRGDRAIQRRLKDYADSLGLPEGASKVRVRRTAGSIEIWADYYVSIEFPGFVRDVHFTPRAVGTF